MDINKAPRQDHAMLNWLDQPLGFRRRSGAPFEGTPLDVSDDFEHDPIVAVEAGHPAVELGFEFLVRDILQIAAPPADDAEWAERLLTPPTPDELRRALIPHRRAFVLDDPEFPAFQVRPTPERMQEHMDAHGRDGFDHVNVSTLLADEPTKEAAGKEDFFQKAGSLDLICAGLVLPALYYHMVLFPSAGGGYYGLGRGLGFGSAIKYLLTAGSFWERLWLNVLSLNDAFLGEASWPALCDRRVYPWLDERLRDLSLGQVKPGAARKLRDLGAPVPQTRLELSANDFHPAGIPMPRRYLLDEPIDARCSLTGQEAPCFGSFVRWQQGPDYSPEGWRWWGVAERRVLAREGDGWMLRKRDFPGARGPLRFDDWLHVALGGDSPPPADRAQTVEQIDAPPAIRAFRARRRHLNEAYRRRRRPVVTGGVSVLGAGRGARLSYGVRAIVQFSFGKAVGGTSMREVPLYDLPSTAARSLAIAAARLGERLDEIAKRLRDAARKAISDLHRKLGSEIAGQLNDDFLAAMDRPVIDAITGLAESFAAGEIGDTAIDAELLDRGRRTALAFFDAAFPVIGGDTPSVKIAKERRELVRDLSRLAPRLHTRPESEETAA